VFSAGEPYEQFMGRWSRGLGSLFVTFAGVCDGDAVLDVGSGTGALAAAIAAAAPSGTIIGVDPAEAYVAAAQLRLTSDRVRFEIGDARRLRFADASFDRTMSALMLNFVPDPGTAVREMRRVTRPGGSVAAAVWDYGDGMEMLRVFWDEAVACDPAAAPRDERHMPLCRRGELAALWREQDFEEVVEEPLILAMRFASFDDYWQPFLTQQGPAGAYVASLAADGCAHLRERLRTRLIGEGGDRPVTLSGRAWAVRGKRV
jgi:SAM-dependent methyltransferase